VIVCDGSDMAPFPSSKEKNLVHLKQREGSSVSDVNNDKKKNSNNNHFNDRNYRQGSMIRSSLTAFISANSGT
jgi:hypothetical protein